MDSIANRSARRLRLEIRDQHCDHQLQSLDIWSERRYYSHGLGCSRGRKQDLNPIDHVWVELKRWLYQRYPDLLQTRGGPAAVKKRYLQNV
ncbi:hypothetical protein L211DRAFT_204395 [Terfezia boudieri ATCC MYA-4762]|uniref:Uncharacterized protein n=1 Tax=Terfezia boudieri ATCC MYA-4762 TaxID=1051890 RepID=A0A3N4LTU5_9PEZI|nr:hypothetical protein L211DRAFT_204395 [Terfezia boudieri ATCC MYA-4762]